MQVKKGSVSRGRRFLGLASGVEGKKTKKINRVGKHPAIRKKSALMAFAKND